MAVFACAGAANAKFVDFTEAASTHTFQDGAFSFNLSGQHPDGFQPTSQHAAYNAYGQQGEYIQFSASVRLASMIISKCAVCFDSNPSTFTISLFDAASNLIGTVTTVASSTEETLEVNQSGVSKIKFTFDGADGSNPYGDGRDVAWYSVRDISYGDGVPEPAVWALMIAGFATTGLALRRRRAAAA